MYNNQKQSGTFTTTAPPGTRWNFTISTSGCGQTGSVHSVFQDILNHDPLIFIHLGDFHYKDISSTSLEERHDAIRTVLYSPSQAALFRHTGLAYMWDDHDFLGNDSGFQNTTARDVALNSYRRFIPSYPLEHDPPFHAFTIGTVRFILSDLRSEATDNAIMSQEQKDWLLDEFRRAEEFDFVIWATTKPFMGELNDSWKGQRSTRNIRVSFNHTRNVLAITSDSHILGFDDGSHTYFGVSGPRASFPILMAGPLDRTGGIRAGTFSQGCFATLLERNHQYGVIQYEYIDEPCLIVSGYIQADRIFERRLCGSDIYQLPGTTKGSCDYRILSRRTWTLVSLALAFTLLSCCMVVYLLHIRSLAVLVMASFLVTLLVGAAVPLLRGIWQIHTFEVAVVLLVQAVLTMVFLGGYR